MHLVSSLSHRSNRGIGLGFVRHLSATADNLIFATCRDPSKVDQLSSFISSPECKAKVHVIRLDLKSEEGINKAADEVKGLIGEARLDFLVNNAAAVRPPRYFV
jgi:NAD(P)-dependent dehydrogenase (short-subunit alcohol dehydrogenase family)